MIPDFGFSLKRCTPSCFSCSALPCGGIVIRRAVPSERIRRWPLVEGTAGASEEEGVPQTELRVVGQASRYRVGGEGFEEGGEPELMKTTAFSMIKLEVHPSASPLRLTPPPHP